ncbi:tyrosine-type recombinase/integrase [Burkholderia multivorans]|uniref:tyrosine-type recombinase/integrase n=1 Tax=Burkholderia multivorans TaxID=87883 RepID=UPI0021C1E89A|nr:site-specific integrase [Burkholderia multivorans]
MTLYKRPDSEVWWYEFVVGGKRYRGSTKTTSKREAQAVEVDKRREALEDQRLARDGVKRLSLYQVAEKWLAASEITHRDHKNNTSRVRKLFGDELVQVGRTWELVEGNRYGLPKTLMVHELTQGHLIELKSRRMAEGNSPATINREISLVQTLVGYAASLNVVMPSKAIIWSDRRNRAASLKMKEPKGKLRWLTMEEEARLLKELRKHVRPDDVSGLDNLDLVTLLLDTGARYEEIAALRWTQVDLDAGLLYLYRSKVDNEGGLRLTRRSLDILKRRREQVRPKSYVFPAQELVGRGKTRWADDDRCRGHATGAIQTAIDACGLNDDPSRDRVTPHTFRDTFASRLVQKGVSLVKVQHLLGHANATMTQKYAHLCPDNTGREAADILDSLHAD